MSHFASSHFGAGHFAASHLTGWVNGYMVFSRATPSAASVFVAFVPGSLLSYTVTGLLINSEQWYYVDAVSACRVRSTVSPASRMRRVAMDGTNQLIPPAPNAPYGLCLKLDAGGVVTAGWQHSNTGAEADLDGFNVYLTTGATAFDYDTIDFSIGSSVNSQALGTFANGTIVRCVVRARTSGGVQETNTNEATAVADAAAPTAPTTVTFG